MTETMRAMVRRADGLFLRDLPAPTPGEGQTLVRVLACGICGSDLHAARHLEHVVAVGQRSGAAKTIDPGRDLVMGHEFCAEILAHGPGTTGRLKPGTRVVSTPFNFGPLGPELIGFSTRFGGAYAERLLLTEALLLPVPDHLSAEQAALTEPLAVGAHAVAVAAPGPRSVALVLGCGPIGLAVVSALKRRGVGPVVAADFSPARRARAERLGADIVVDPAAASPHAHWSAAGVPATLAELGPARLAGRDLRDAVIFECVGSPGVIRGLVESGPPGAHLVIVGACLEDDAFLPVIAINKQLRMSFVFAYSAAEFAETLGALAAGAIDPDVFLTGTVGLAETPAAFEALASPGDQVKVMVQPWR